MSFFSATFLLKIIKTGMYFVEALPEKGMLVV